MAINISLHTDLLHPLSTIASIPSTSSSFRFCILNSENNYFSPFFLFHFQTTPSPICCLPTYVTTIFSIWTVSNQCSSKPHFQHFSIFLSLSFWLFLSFWIPNTDFFIFPPLFILYDTCLPENPFITLSLSLHYSVSGSHAPITIMTIPVKLFHVLSASLSSHYSSCLLLHFALSLATHSSSSNLYGNWLTSL